MALVLLLRGVNVGGHRRFRPSTLAAQLRHLDAVSIGAAGTFVVRKPITRARLRLEIQRRLPFDTAVMICGGDAILRLMALEPFAEYPVRPDLVRFATLLSRNPRPAPPLPIHLPSDREGCLVKVFARHGRIVLGVHRREMRAIRCLGQLDHIFNTPATTRSWNTIVAIARTLGWRAGRL
jgi:uncharacterized protein (DUF1697 family)